MIPDQEFRNPRLAAIYDYLDSDRSDLDHYLNIIDHIDANSVLDIGCGTGSLLCLLATRVYKHIKDYKLCGVDPAAASLNIARGKAGSESVNWVLGNAASLPVVGADIGLMTGNVAQVFLTNEDWLSALASIRCALLQTGCLVFESRNPARRAWDDWNRSSTLTRIDVPGIGVVVSWVDLIDVSLPLVSFKWTFEFEQDGAVLTSESTLRFRSKQEIELSLERAGYNLLEVRDAPDRPGREFVFIAKVANN